MPAHRGVAVAQRRQPERAVEPGVLVVADPDQGQLEQPDDRREDLLAGQARPARGPVAAVADARAAPSANAISRSNFASSRRVAIAGVVAVLLAPRASRPVAWRWPFGPRADPDVGPGRRDGQRADPLERLLVADRRAVRVAVGEAATGAPAGDPRAGRRWSSAARPRGRASRSAAIGRSRAGRRVGHRATRARPPRAPSAPRRATAGHRASSSLQACDVGRAIGGHAATRPARKWPGRARLTRGGRSRPPTRRRDRDDDRQCRPPRSPDPPARVGRAPGARPADGPRRRRGRRRRRRQVRRPLAVDGIDLTVPRGHDPRDHRPVRRRQDDDDPDADRRARPDQRRGPRPGRDPRRFRRRTASGSATCPSCSRSTRT